MESYQVYIHNWYPITAFFFIQQETFCEGLHGPCILCHTFLRSIAIVGGSDREAEETPPFSMLEQTQGFTHSKHSGIECQ